MPSISVKFNILKIPPTTTIPDSALVVFILLPLHDAVAQYIHRQGPFLLLVRIFHPSTVDDVRVTPACLDLC